MRSWSTAGCKHPVEYFNPWLRWICLASLVLLTMTETACLSLKAGSLTSTPGWRLNVTQCKSFLRYNNYLIAIYLSLPLNSNSISWKQFIVFSFSLILCWICFSSSLSLFCTWRYYKLWGRRRIEKLVLIYARRDTSFALFSTPRILDTALDHAN